ncbi:hypothetical protein [Mycobacteroides abscessus]|uniref:hypothetical protein n=1 Tax=Mycobacteroides abscessus TaxID=36809 RepID=UPI000940CAA2|nr:hypothetical protein [Mycobacteroides abscessus]
MIVPAFLRKTLLITAALGAVATGGITAAAEAAAAPMPTYHWCPGEFWNPIWGLNISWNECSADGILDRDRPDGWRADDGRDKWGKRADGGPDNRRDDRRDTRGDNDWRR